MHLVNDIGVEEVNGPTSLLKAIQYFTTTPVTTQQRFAIGFPTWSGFKLANTARNATSKGRLSTDEPYLTW